MWKSKWNTMTLINPETKKTWNISVDGDSITTQLDSRKPKTITDELPNMKSSGLIIAQMKKGFIYSDPDANDWEPYYHTFLNRGYTGFMPIATNKKRSDFYVFRVENQFEDEIILHFNSEGKMLDRYHLGKDRMTYRALLLDDGNIVLHSAYSAYNKKFIELFDPNNESLSEVHDEELIHIFDTHDDHVDILKKYKVSYLGYNDPYNRGIFKVEDTKDTSLVSEFYNEFVSKNAFCAFSSNSLIIHTDNGVLSLYKIPT